VARSAIDNWRQVASPNWNGAVSGSAPVATELGSGVKVEKLLVAPWVPAVKARSALAMSPESRFFCILKLLKTIDLEPSACRYSRDADACLDPAYERPGISSTHACTIHAK
jgi:hypothetical protein